MKTEIDKISRSIEARLNDLKGRLGGLALEGDFERLQAVTEQAKELERGGDLLRQAERCIGSAERKLEALLRTHTKAPLTILRVTICWTKLGVAADEEVIEERTAADTLMRLFERLSEQMGIQILERASKVIHGDRPLLSRSPTRDWVNPNSGEPYTARSIGRTGWYVITHSATQQKIDQIQAVSQGLGFLSSAIRAEAVARPSID